MFQDTSPEIDSLASRIEELGFTYQWFILPHPQLGGQSAIEAIRAGHIEKVENIIEQIESGAYL